MAEPVKRPKKARIRKALTVKEQTELARTNSQSAQKTTKVSVAKRRLPRPAILRSLGKVFIAIFRPLRPVLRPLRWLMPVYFVNSWRELRQVSWPNRRETWRLTLAVFIFAIVFGLAVAGVDWVLDQLFKKVILNK